MGILHECHFYHLPKWHFGLIPVQLQLPQQQQIQVRMQTRQRQLQLQLQQHHQHQQQLQHGFYRDKVNCIPFFFVAFLFSQALDLSLLLRESTRNFDSMHRRCELLTDEVHGVEGKEPEEESPTKLIVVCLIPENQWLEDKVPLRFPRIFRVCLLLVKRRVDEIECCFFVEIL